MKMPIMLILSWLIFFSLNILADEPVVENPLVKLCIEDLGRVQGGKRGDELKLMCSKVQQIDGCESENKKPIFHFERPGTVAKGKRILAMSLIHGDEMPSGVVTQAWITRLERIDPRNSWRVIPIANPDGFYAKSRTNSKGIDLNRNFPTEEWEDSALKN